MDPLLIVIGMLILVLIALVAVFASRYRTAKPDEALIVTGSFLGNKNTVTDESGRKMKIIRGGGVFVLPIFQNAQSISLLSYMLDVKTPEVYTEQGVPIIADGTAIIKVGSTLESISTAAEQFLGKAVQELRSEASEVLEGHLRAILGSMTVEEIYQNRDRFAQEVQGVAAKDLHKMGLQIVSFTIKDVRDNNGYLESLGKPRIAAIKRDAEIAQAEAEKEARIKKAEAERYARQSEIIRDTQIAEAEKDRELKVAEYKKEQDKAKAEADQAYHLQDAIARQRVVEEQMKIQIIEREKQIELEEREIQRREKQYDSEVKKKADADRYSIEQAAEAEKARRMREADAHQYQIETAAKAQAEQKRLDGLAIAESEKVKGLAEAEVIRKRGESDAEVIRLKGLSEAEAKEKLAEAYEKFGQAAMLDIIVKMLPELAQSVAQPLANIQKITVVDAGGETATGANKVSNYVTNLMATMPDMVKDVSGVDIKEILQRYASSQGLEDEAAATRQTRSSILVDNQAVERQSEETK